MAKYWVYINDQVSGPYEVERLVRVRGFSRQTQVCLDDQSGSPTHWISPAEIPELARIFKAVDQFNEIPAPAPVVKPPAKPVVQRVVVRTVPVSAAPVPASPSSNGWVWAIVVALLLGAGGAGGYFVWQQHKQLQSEQLSAAKHFVEEARLPANSRYATLRDYFTEKEIKPRWNLEKASTGLFNVTTSFYAGSPSEAVVYAFEVNLEAQTIRGLNTAGIHVLAVGFPPPVAPAPLVRQKAVKAPAEKFREAEGQRREAFEKGEFSQVWDSFSTNRRSQMTRAGISESGFVRIQGLTHGLEAGIKQTVLKTKDEGEGRMLVLLRQTQPNRPDMFLKQTWVTEEGAWKLDEEEKKAATEQAPQGPPVSDNPGKVKPNVISLPGIAH